MSSMHISPRAKPLSTQIDRFEEMFRRMMRPMAMESGWAGDIRVDVLETDKEYQVRAAVPGIKKEDIQVSIDRNYVAISTDTKPEKESKSGNGARLLVNEVYQGHASREMSLAHEVDDKAAVAKVEDGILTLTLPKRKDTHTKVLRIQ